MKQIINILNKEEKTEDDISFIVKQLQQFLDTKDYESINFIQKNLDSDGLDDFNIITEELHNSFYMQDSKGKIFKFIPFVIPIIIQNDSPVESVSNLNHIVTLFRKNKLITKEEGIILLPNLISFNDIQEYDFITEHKINSSLNKYLTDQNLEDLQRDISTIFPPTKTNANFQFKFILGFFINDVDSNSHFASHFEDGEGANKIIKLCNSFKEMKFNIPINTFTCDVPLLITDSKLISYYFYHQITVPLLAGLNPQINTMKILMHNEDIDGLEVGDTIIENMMLNEEFMDFVNLVVEETNKIKALRKDQLIKLVTEQIL